MMYENKDKNQLPRGCEYCSEGAKGVYFITGVCDKDCFYCPISREKKGKNNQWINERKISSTDELIDELEKMNAKGLSITGGEPLLFLDEVIKKIKTLKKSFGKSFHIHLYTSKAISKNELRKLGEAGLDEIRFHPPDLELNKELMKTIKKSQETIEATGIEVPAIPGRINQLKGIIEKTKEYLDFVNLNEFEYSEETFKEINKRGYESKQKKRQSIKGSHEIAIELIKLYKYEELTIHYCPSHYKDSIQLRNRFLRRAKNVSKEHETVTEDGTIIKAIIKTNEPKSIVKELKNNSVPEELIKNKKNLIETTCKVADELKNKLIPMAKEISIIEEHPTENRLRVQKIKLK